MDDSDAMQIAKLNDGFRRNTPHIIITRGASVLPDLDDLLDEIRRDKDFSEDNDPYGEHDFGAVQWWGEKVWWKIDYYDRELERWEDPLSPKCRRVLTVLLPDEW